MCQSVFLFKIHKNQFFREMHKGGCTILCSSAQIYMGRPMGGARKAAQAAAGSIFQRRNAILMDGI